MLVDQDDMEPGYEERHALRARVIAAGFGDIAASHGIVDVMNAVAVLVLEMVSDVIPREDLAARGGIAEHLRHVASHVDLTCPHIAEEDQGPPPSPPRAPLH